MLMLVHPAPQGKDPGASRRKRRRDVNSLTATEKRHLRATLTNLARAYGSWKCLAHVMGMHHGSLHSAAHPTRPRGSPGVALAAARAGRMSIEAVLGGKLSAAGRCPTCGHKAGDGRLVAAGGAP